jgi:L-ascorbate metabolism protein UlaG (beta-lactamase superfamily)
MRSLFSGLLLAVGISAAGSGDQLPTRLDITYLGNMGVLIEAGNRRVVIDGLHHGGVSHDYTEVPAEMLAALETAREPFGHLDFLLVTHRHADHFDPASVRSRLSRDSTVMIVAARETVDSLFADGSRSSSRPPTVRAITPAPGTEERVERDGVTVRVLNLPHNPVRSRRPENVGFLVQLGGHTVLHVGDADPDERTFAAYRLADRRIDVAIVPYWYPTSRVELIRKIIAPRYLVATHVGPGEGPEAAARVTKAFPDATVFTRPGERWGLPVVRGR